MNERQNEEPDAIIEEMKRGNDNNSRPQFIVLWLSKPNPLP